MRGSIALLVCALAIPVCGCSKDEPAEPVRTQPNWDAKFAAADGIRQVEVKDDAMAGLAKHAAEAGSHEVVRKALDSIRNVQNHDQAARSCAVALATTGLVESARQIAEHIHDTAIQDDTLKQIAQIK